MTASVTIHAHRGDRPVTVVSFPRRRRASAYCSVILLGVDHYWPADTEQEAVDAALAGLNEAVRLLTERRYRLTHSDIAPHAEEQGQ